MERKVSCAVGRKKAAPPVAAKGDEVQIAFAEDAFEELGLGERKDPPFAKGAKGRPPGARSRQRRRWCRIWSDIPKREMITNTPPNSRSLYTCR